jgi:endonuclease YncB( thermonuclease family)
MFLRVRFHFFAAGLLFFLTLQAISAAASFQAARVTDGDTIRLRAGDDRLVIRLVGIDAPEVSHRKNEPGQTFSDQATKRLASLVLNRSVEIKAHGQDRYGHTNFRVGSWALLEGRGASTKCAKKHVAASGADWDGRGLYGR